MTMRGGLRIIAGTALIVAVAGGLVAGGVYAAGGRINTSKSLELGLYWTVDRPVAVGTYVMFCPPEQKIFIEAKKRGYVGAGFCPGGFSPLMKKVLAARGDTIAVTPRGVTVNGQVLPYSKPVPVDGLGRALPHVPPEEHTLDASELLLMTDISPTSFDGRYFGPISIEQITAVIRPVLTWKGE